MDLKLFFLSILIFVTVKPNAQSDIRTEPITDLIAPDNYDLYGQWLRMGQPGPMRLLILENGHAEIDLGDDHSVEVTATYEISGDTLWFSDQDGSMCPDEGVYQIHLNPYYLAFDYISDECNGRVKTLMGFWVRPGFEKQLASLTEEIEAEPEPSLFLSRARMYMALGKPIEAKADLDRYLQRYPEDGRALVNRAGTRFPDDLKGVVSDCEMAIEIDPAIKNAWFLRGIALYGLGQKEKACTSFKKAIELGFSILRIAEYERCAAYWEKG